MFGHTTFMLQDLEEKSLLCGPNLFCGSSNANRQAKINFFF